MFAQSAPGGADEGRHSMNRVHKVTLGMLAVVTGACVPFLGPLPPDGGGEKSDGASASNGGPLGHSCGVGTDCNSGRCVEGVCCTTACADKCMSCLNANTAALDGTCAPIKAGLSHGGDCTVADQESCGFDGKCDGVGACRYWATGTNCAAESCIDGAGSSSYSSSRICDGAGTCNAATPSTCGGTFRCSGAECRTTCSAPSDCIAAAYCSSSTCTRKKTDGAVCADDIECLNGVCGGRCCAAGCSCTQPNSTNLLKNPGFDVDASGWTIDSGSLIRTSGDAEGCPYSGSLFAVAGPSFTQFSQCVPNVHLDGVFTFGIRMMDASAICGVRFYVGSNCDGDEVVDDELHGPMTVSFWQSPTPEAGDPNVPVSGANSVLFFCDGTGTFDMAYVSLAPEQY
jgi:hypothetical protein